MQITNTRNDVEWTLGRNGALDGWTYQCRRCATNFSSTLVTQSEQFARQHDRWHETRDRAAQPFANARA